MDPKNTSRPSTTLKAAALYVALAWSAGFVFGVVRELALKPLIGPVWAQLAEAPVMATVTWLAAGYVLRKLSPAPLATGLLAAAVLIVIETVFALGIRGQSVSDYLAAFDMAAAPFFRCSSSGLQSPRGYARNMAPGAPNTPSPAPPP